MRHCLRFLILLYIGCMLTSCTRDPSMGAISETEEKHYQRAQRLLREGREDEALNAFLKVVEKRNDAAESHLEAGRLYATHIGDPVAAIYHYRKYLEIKPDSDQAERVEQLIDSSKKEFARQLPGQPFRNDIERLDLLEMLDQAKEENTLLKQQLVATQRRLSQYESTQVRAPTSTTSTSRPTTTTPTAPSAHTTTATTTTSSSTVATNAAATSPARVHTVTQGDTLSSISIKYYGTPRRFLDIFEANRDVMGSPDSLRIGQQLKIPND